MKCTDLGYFKLFCKRIRQTVKVLNSLAFIYSIPNFVLAAPRNPASFVSTDEVIVVPRSQESWYDGAIVDDDAGVLNSMRVDIRRWQEQDNYVRQWGLQNTGMYTQTTREQKQARISRDLLIYTDKRLTGEIKRAEKGSNLHRVGQVQSALQPNTTVSIFDGYAIKFQVRAIQTKATIYFKNPYVDTHLDMTLGGRREFVTEKKWDFGLRTAINMRIEQNYYFTTIEQRLTDTITASLVSQQSMNEPAFSSQSDRRIQLNYFRPF